MREIKFRAWDGLTNEMTDTEEFLNDYISDPRYILMQYTGLKDKNEQEIYEKSIVQYLGRKGNVYWGQDGLWCIKWNEKDWNHAMHTFTASELEVIGDIYRNPEL